MFHRMKSLHSLGAGIFLGFIVATGCTPATQDPHKISTETANLLTSSMDFNGARTEILPIAQKPAENAGNPAYPQVTQLSAPGQIGSQSFELDIYTDYQNASDVVGAVMYIPPATEFMTIGGSLQPVTSSAEAMRFAALKGISQTQTLYFMRFIITLDWDKSFGGKIPKIEFALMKSDGTVGNYWIWEPEIATDPADGGQPVDAGADGSEPIDAGTDSGIDAGADAGTPDGGEGCDTMGLMRCEENNLMICNGTLWIFYEDCTLTNKSCVTPMKGTPACVRTLPYFAQVKTNDYRFDPRYGHTSAIFNGEVLVIVGNDNQAIKATSDVWSSADGVNWLQKTRAIEELFKGRFGHTTVIFNDRLWIIGGNGNPTYPQYLNDVWSSSDGKTWTNESQGAVSRFTARAFHSSVTFPDPNDGNIPKIWVIGGYGDTGIYDDVWASADGKEWEQKVVPGTYSQLMRYQHTSNAYKGKIWIVGGSGTNGTLNNYISSANGITWSAATPMTGVPQRHSHSSVVANDKLYIFGGVDDPPLNDVWSFDGDGGTTDGGTTWTKVRDKNAPDGFTSRYSHTTVAFGDGFLLTGGKDYSTSFNDVWSSADGITWTPVLPNGYPVVAPRYSHTGVNLEGQLAVIAGEAISAGDSQMFNDLWLSSDGVNWAQAPQTLPNTTMFHSSVVFKPEGETAERAYVIAGINGITYSSTNEVFSYDSISGWRNDGDAGFSPRSNAASTVFRDPSDQKDKIWVIGGCTNGYPCQENDVWASENGRYWINVSDGGTNLIQPKRDGHCSVTFDGGMWVIGGTSYDIETFYKDDVWYSANGRDWQKTVEVTDRFSPRADHACAVYDNNMWVVGGRAESMGLQIIMNDAWYSSDGTNWIQYCDSDTCEFPARFKHSITTMDGYLWMFGGMGAEQILMNDVYKTDGK